MLVDVCACADAFALLMLMVLPTLKITLMLVLVLMLVLTFMVIMIFGPRFGCRLAMAGHEKSAIAAHELLGRMQDQGTTNYGGIKYQGTPVQT